MTKIPSGRQRLTAEKTFIREKLNNGKTLVFVYDLLLFSM